MRRRKEGSRTSQIQIRNNTHRYTVGSFTTFLRSRFKVLFLQVTRVTSPNKESERNPLLERNLLRVRMRKRRSKVNESRIFKYSGKLVCGRFQSIRNSKFAFFRFLADPFLTPSPQTLSLSISVTLSLSHSISVTLPLSHPRQLVCHGKDMEFITFTHQSWYTENGCNSFSPFKISPLKLFLLGSFFFFSLFISFTLTLLPLDWGKRLLQLVQRYKSLTSEHPNLEERRE